MANETIERDLRTAVRAKDGTLYRAGKAVKVKREHAKEFGWTGGGQAASSTRRPGGQGGAGDGEPAAELPKVADLESHLAEITSADDVRAMQARDTRATAQEHYENRLLQLERPTIEDLPDHLAGIDDRDQIERMAMLDDRTTAAPIYEARLAELDG